MDRPAIEPAVRVVALDALLRRSEVVRLTGRSKWALAGDIRAGLFTPPVVIGANAVAWPASEVAALNRARVAGLDREELRALVAALLVQRKTPTGQDSVGAQDARAGATLPPPGKSSAAARRGR